MAEGGSAEGGLYGPDHGVSTRLLTYIATHIKTDDLMTLAIRHLGMGVPEYTQCTDRLDGINKIIVVLERWKNKGNIKVIDLLRALARWQEDGLVEHGVWRTLEEHVEPGLIETIGPAVKPDRSTSTSTSSSLKSLCYGIHKRKPELEKFAEPIPHHSPTMKAVMTEEDRLIQDLTKKSLKQKLKNSLSTDWLPSEKARRSCLVENYIQLEWSEIKRKPIQDEERPLSSIYNIFKDTPSDEGLNYAVLGAPGIGKSCSMALVAMKWVSGEGEMKHFDYLFFIILRNVTSGLSLEELIIDNHWLLKQRKSSPKRIRSILYGDTDYRVAILMDGYDEYCPGSNTAIDEAIEHTVGNCILVLTSRHEAVKEHIKGFMSGGIITIKGLSWSSIVAFCKKLFGTEEMTYEMLEQAQQVNIDDLFYIPIILLMACVIYIEKKSLPESQTKVFHDILHMMISRSMHRLPEAEKLSPDQIEELLYQLGRLSLEALTRDEHQVEINENALNGASHEILKKLGVLFATGIERASSTGERWYGFPHKALQEFSGSDFLSKDMKKAKNPEDVLEVLKKWFPSGELLEHQQVIHFTYELLEDAPVQRKVLTEYVWQVYSDYVFDDDDDYYSELRDILPASAHHTESGHLYRYRDPVPIHTLSQRYVFEVMYEALEWKVPPGTTVPEQLKECEVLIRGPVESVADNLLSVCGTISQHQTIRRLRIRELKHSGTTPGPVINLSPNIEKVEIRVSKIPDDTMNHLMNQLPRLHRLRELDLYSTTLPGSLPALPPSLQVLNLRYTTLPAPLPALPPSLQLLNLEWTGLKDVSEVVLAVQRPTLREVNLRENDLGEEAVGRVMEAAVTHRPHQELELYLWDNNLSREFMDRWSRRCAGTEINPHWRSLLF